MILIFRASCSVPYPRLAHVLYSCPFLTILFFRLWRTVVFLSRSSALCMYWACTGMHATVVMMQRCACIWYNFWLKQRMLAPPCFLVSGSARHHPPNTFQIAQVSDGSVFFYKILGA